MESVQKQLEELGLHPNEAKAYLAALELGSATAQQIAAKAAVVRPTAYVAIGGLVKRGLMSSYTKGKKQYFQAEKPDQLMRLLVEEKKKLVEKEQKFKKTLPELSALLALSGKRPNVRYYEGFEALNSLREVLYSSRSKHVDVFGFSEAIREVLSEEDRVVHDFKLKKSRISGRQIVIISSNAKRPKQLIKQSGWQFKYVTRNKFESPSEIAIFDDYVALIAYDRVPAGFLIHSHHLAEIMRLQFELAWGP